MMLINANVQNVIVEVGAKLTAVRYDQGAKIVCFLDNVLSQRFFFFF